jgi:hypothetical protein
MLFEQLGTPSRFFIRFRVIKEFALTTFNVQLIATLNLAHKLCRELRMAGPEPAATVPPSALLPEGLIVDPRTWVAIQIPTPATIGARTNVATPNPKRFHQLFCIDGVLAGVLLS